MRWFLTAERTLIPEKSIVKIAPGADGSAQAYVLDQRGVLGVVQLMAPFDDLTEKLDETTEPAAQRPGAPAKMARDNR